MPVTMMGAAKHLTLGLLLLSSLALALSEGQHRALADDDAEAPTETSSIVPSAGAGLLWNNDGDVSAAGRALISLCVGQQIGGMATASSGPQHGPPGLPGQPARGLAVSCGMPVSCTAGACAGDIKAVCKDVGAGEGRLAACLTKRLRAQRQGNAVGEQARPAAGQGPCSRS